MRDSSDDVHCQGCSLYLRFPVYDIEGVVATNTIAKRDHTSEEVHIIKETFMFGSFENRMLLYNPCVVTFRKYTPA